MIKWMDFVFEDHVGVFLDEIDFKSCRKEQSDVLSVMEDTKNDSHVHNNQETGQGSLPARMVGLSSSEWVDNVSMEADQNDLTTLRLKGEG